MKKAPVDDWGLMLWTREATLAFCTLRRPVEQGPPSRNLPL